MTIELHTNVKDTTDFRRLLTMKLEEGAMRFIRDKFRNNELVVDFELIKQTDDYNKDAKLIIKDIQKVDLKDKLYQSTVKPI